MHPTTRTRLAFPLIALLALAVTGCPVNPATGERQLILISESEEIAMGRQASEQVDATIGIYPDQDLQEYVGEIGQKLAAETTKPNLPWSFKVVDDVVVNAFALPGGFIYVTRGILAHFNSEAELAGVLGHEIGHVTGRHSAEQISRAQAAQLGLGLGSAFVPEIAQYGDLLGASLGLLFLKFGRDDERQADDLGFRYMRQSAYDPREMVDVFAMLERVSGSAGGSSLPSWLSTHPDPGERQERMRRMIDQLEGTVDGEVNRERYLRHIDGLVFGVNPRNGYFRGSTFLHPDLEFRFVFPEGWKTQNMSHAVAGISSNEDALIQLTLATEATLDAAAEKFLSQQGIRTVGTSSDPVHGLPARWAAWRATTQDGNELAGLALFLTYDGNIYQILGYTIASRMGTYEGSLRSSLGSFDRLTDQAALNVQPRRLDIVELDRAMTVAELVERYQATADAATLALINGVDAETAIPAGRLVKVVVGGNLPE